jgi:hypothetical protein
MKFLPNETAEQYAQRYREGWSKHRECLFMGTTAMHKLGDLSRDNPDYFIIDEEGEHTEDYYVGSWVTGFGFVNVKFPKTTSRPVTDEEWEWFLDNPVVLQ